MNFDLNILVPTSFFENSSTRAYYGFGVGRLRYKVHGSGSGSIRSLRAEDCGSPPVIGRPLFTRLEQLADRRKSNEIEILEKHL